MDQIGSDRTPEFAGLLNINTYIFLYISGHPFDVLSHTFFQCGFSPRKLPQSAVSQAPTFPLDTVLSNGNSAENIGKIEKKSFSWKSLQNILMYMTIFDPIILVIFA